MAVHFLDPDWILNEKNGFMSDYSLAPSKYFLKNCIQKAERSIIRKRGHITSGKVIAEQSLGFWTSLFDTHHYRLIGGVPIQCFPNKPASVNRNILNQKLNRIREFRNRVYHNEPICFKNRHIDFTHAQNIKNEIFELLDWIDPELSNYVTYFNGIDSKIVAANKLFTDP